VNFQFSQEAYKLNLFLEILKYISYATFSSIKSFIYCIQSLFKIIIGEIQIKMKDKKYDELYKKADIFLKKQSDAESVTPGDIWGIMQEISTYRVELDMQNDELQKTRLELEESRDKYMKLYNLAPVAYLTIDKDDKILEANTACIKLFGSNDNLKSMTLSKFITSSSQDVFYLHKQKVFETMKKEFCEIEFHLADGTKFNALLQSIAIQEKKKKSINIVIVDLAEIKK
jgi:PAS domain S-box-containing protein